VTIRSNAVQQDDRRSRRTDVRLAASIDAGPGRIYPVIINNVSAHGVMAELGVQLVPGRPVTVTLAGLDKVLGRVAWLRDGHIGIAFVEPLTLDQINAIL
jgi:PilZ domain